MFPLSSILFWLTRLGEKPFNQLRIAIRQVPTVVTDAGELRVLWIPAGIPE
jgi:hypothetical protein